MRKTHQLSVRFSTGLYEALAAASKMEDLPMSEIIRRGTKAAVAEISVRHGVLRQ